MTSENCFLVWGSLHTYTHTPTHTHTHTHTHIHTHRNWVWEPFVGMYYKTPFIQCSGKGKIIGIDIGAETVREGQD